MAQRKSKEYIMAGDDVSTEDIGKWKRRNPADSAGTDGAIEGQSPVENSTNKASHATRAAKKPNRNK